MTGWTRGLRAALLGLILAGAGLSAAAQNSGIDAVIDRLAARAGTPGGADTAAAAQAQTGTTAEALAGTAVDSLSAAERAVLDNPRDLRAMTTLALTRLREGQPQEAAVLAERLRQLSPTAAGQAGALALGAEALLAQGRTTQAIAMYRQAVALDRRPAYLRRLAVLGERQAFTLVDVTVDAERTLATACATFSGPLRKPLPARDYVTLSPAADVDVSATGNRLCVRGLRHGQRYTLTLKAGLPGARGALARAEQRVIDVGNRAERVTLGTGRYVLPRTGEALVPLRTVNLSKVHLSLYAIGARNLIWALANERLGQQLSSSEGREIAQTSGEALWEGTVAVANRRNLDVTTLVSLDTMLKGRPGGLYALVARTPAEEASDESWQPRATQWVLVSDIGLTAFDGADGLTVFARALGSARPLAQVRLQLIGRNNTILGEVTTNADGKALFSPGLMRGEGGRAPAFLLARGTGADINVLRLTGAALDLSERGVDGQPAVRTALDGFLYTERGLYRPGETIRLSGLVRGAGSVAAPKLPVQLALIRPDGRELTRVRVTTDAAGALGADLAVPAGARTGRWSVRALVDPAAPAIGEVSVQVQDFVPQRIEVSARGPAGLVDPGAAVPVAVAARYYFGAPGANLPGDVSTRIVADETPFPAYRGWSFGRVEEGFEPASTAPERFTTDAAGRAQLNVALGELPSSTRPLKALVGVNLFDVGGRPVYVQVGARLRTRAVEIGLRSRFGDSLADGESAQVDIVALAADGRALGGRSLTVSWVREDHETAWYEDGGSWYARSVVNDTLVASQSVTTDAKGRALAARTLPAGRYRLEVEDSAGEAVSSWRFWSGWWSSGEVANAPDALELNLEQDDLAGGATLRALVKAPFDGQALVAVVSNRVHLTRTVTLKKAGTTISLPVDPRWGPGAYLLVTAYRPQAGAISPLPVRAMGLAWFGIDRAKRTLAVKLSPPEALAPRQRVSLPVTVAGAAGQPVTLTLMAVDEGVLALTRFQSPKPEAHFFGRRQLGLDVRDLYGQLILPAAGARGALTRTGGDAVMDNATGLSVRSTRIVALVQRQVRLDAAGRGQAVLDLPDFNGRLRLMAVAATPTQVGSGEAPLVVRDPVVADLILPRFLSPGDRAEATLTLHNLTSQPVTVAPRLTWGALNGPAGIAARTLAPGQRVDVLIPLGGNALGATRIALALPLASGAVNRSWDIEVRAPSTRVTNRTALVLAPGETRRLDPTLVSALSPVDARVALTLTNRPDFDVAGLLEALGQYPYGCTEQIVSAALPLLYFGDVAQRWGLASNATDLRASVDRAVLRLVERQGYDGGMGLWSSAGAVDPWVSAYAYDFLTRAQAAGVSVPPKALAELTRYLIGQVGSDWNNTPESRAYALYVLARTARLKASDVRYFNEQTGGALRTRLAVAQLAAALAAVGEPGLANAQFARAGRIARPATLWQDYGSAVRDAAASLVLLADATRNPQARIAQASGLERLVNSQNWPWSTQEQAWLLMAARAVADTGGAPVQARLGTTAVGPSAQPVRRALPLASVRQGLGISNTGSGPLRVLASVRGQPLSPPPASADGFTVRRRLIGLNGAPVDAAALRQNDRVIVVVDGIASAGAIGHPLVVDLLPAGLEIEAVLTPDTAQGTPVADLLSPAEFQDARDDRFVAAPGLDDQRSFRLAYVARAITPGQFVHPGTFVEDMYQPRFNARTAPGRLTIVRR